MAAAAAVEGYSQCVCVRVCFRVNQYAPLAFVVKCHNRTAAHLALGASVDGLLYAGISARSPLGFRLTTVARRVLYDGRSTGNGPGAGTLGSGPEGHSLGGDSRGFSRRDLRGRWLAVRLYRLCLYCQDAVQESKEGKVILICGKCMCVCVCTFFIWYPIPKG